MKTRRFQVLAAIWRDRTPGHKHPALSHPLPHFILFFKRCPKTAKMSSKHKPRERIRSSHTNQIGQVGLTIKLFFSFFERMKARKTHDIHNEKEFSSNKTSSPPCTAVTSGFGQNKANIFIERNYIWLIMIFISDMSRAVNCLCPMTARIGSSRPL